MKLVTFPFFFTFLVHQPALSNLPLVSAGKGYRLKRDPEEFRYRFEVVRRLADEAKICALAPVA
ncbi:hypothetical protein GGP75_001217 [Salinibacter ruber]|nr:hypothetical protein [Salinibacter ruber]